jgi:hypothetical protein
MCAADDAARDWGTTVFCRKLVSRAGGRDDAAASWLSQAQCGGVLRLLENELELSRKGLARLDRPKGHVRQPSGPRHAKTPPDAVDQDRVQLAGLQLVECRQPSRDPGGVIIASFAGFH